MVSTSMAAKTAGMDSRIIVNMRLNGSVTEVNCNALRAPIRIGMKIRT